MRITETLFPRECLAEPRGRTNNSGSAVTRFNERNRNQKATFNFQDVVSWVIQNSDAATPRLPVNVDNCRTNKLMNPQCAIIGNRFGVQKLIGQFFCIVAVVDTFEMNNESVLLRTNSGDNQGALLRTRENNKRCTHFMAGLNI